MLKVKQADTRHVDRFEIIAGYNALLKQVHAGRRPACTWFLEIAFVREVGVCVCPPPRALITTHVK